ncbi:methyltransferase domain-containing protein [Polynucleobacter duraquae]|nr:methyltransferase domain-containing protein [Polynucleobacter duraquae]
MFKKQTGRALLGRNPFDLAYYFCKGNGLEVGARNNPYSFARGCKVSYADIGNTDEIKSILAEGFRLGLKREESGFVGVDLILRGPRYGFELIGNNFFDFVYSDNVLEHTPNPIFAIVEQLRVTKVGGYVYTVIPNKYFTFDRNREATPASLLIEKYQKNIFHYTIDEALDIILKTENFPSMNLEGDALLDHARKMILANDGEYHFHVFDIKNTMEMLDYICQNKSATLRYFSAPDFKYIHFAICKEA